MFGLITSRVSSPLDDIDFHNSIGMDDKRGTVELLSRATISDVERQVLSPPLLGSSSAETGKSPFSDRFSDRSSRYPLWQAGWQRRWHQQRHLN